MTTLLLIWATAAWAANPHGGADQDWLTPLAVLVLGVVFGYVFLARQVESDASIDEEAREIDLSATRDEVVEALRQLEVEKSKMDPGQYEVERQQLLARGAQALRELEDDVDGEGDAPAEAPAESTAGAPPAADKASPPAGVMAFWDALAPEWRGALTALTAVAVVGLLYIGLQSDTRERREGDPITGSDIVTQDNTAPEGLEGAPPQIRAQVEAFETQLQENPQDLSTLNTLTQLYLSANVPGPAMEYNNQVLEIDPKNKDGRAYRGVLRMMIGMGDKAIDSFDEVLADDPNHLLSLFYKGLVLMEFRRFDEAVTALEAAIAQDPNNPNLTRVLADAKALADGKSPGAPPPPSGDLIVRGTIDIDPAARGTLLGNEVVFVSVKGPDNAGPPVAAIKVPARFPGPFQITTADMRAMGGGATAVPDQLTLTVRIDLDGNAMTKEDAPLSVVRGVRRGAEGLQVTLTRDGSPAQAAAPAPAASGGGVLAEGTVALAPGRDASGVLFVSLRSAAGGGPPIAAKRFPNPTFPISFRITKQDMLPMWSRRPLPDQLILKAHVDRDGNAGTQEDGPAAVAPPIAPGATGLSLTLE